MILAMRRLGVRRSATTAPIAVFVAMALVAGGCGGDDAKLMKPGPVPEAVKAAETVDTRDFPAAGGRTVTELAAAASSAASYGAANSVFVPGANRLAFALIGSDGKPLYAPTVVYVAPGPKAPAQGPFAAPADPMVPQSAYLSKTAAADANDVKAIYEAQVPLASAGKWQVLTLSRTASGIVGSAGAIEVVKSSPIPAVGQKAPLVTTPTVGSVGGDIGSIDTRDPHAPSLHQDDFAKVVGTKPVALLLATPALCQSRVCGPVTDLLLQLQAAYGSKVAMIQQEVYRNNNPKDGFTAPLEAFRLETEPWLFTVGKDGRIKARLEGAFGIRSMERAIDAAGGAR